MFETLGPLELLLLLGIPVVGALVAIAIGRARRVEAPAAPVDIPAMIQQGWRVESESDTYTVLVRGQRPNHILHLLLSVFTLGLWIIVWVIIAATGGEERQVINKPRREGPSGL